MRYRITYTDGTVEEIEADYWTATQSDGPSWAHYHGNDEVCNEQCHIEDEEHR